MLLRPPEKDLCKQLLGSCLVLLDPPSLGISALSGEGGNGYFLELHNSEKMFDAYYF